MPTNTVSVSRQGTLVLTSAHNTMSLSLGYIYYEATTLLQPLFGYLFNRAMRLNLFDLTILSITATFTHTNHAKLGKCGSSCKEIKPPDSISMTGGFCVYRGAEYALRSVRLQTL